MNLIGNILWLIFGGFFIFLEYMVSGLILSITIIGIPFGLQCFKIGVASLFPFGTKVVNKENTSNATSLLFNIIWIIIGGLWISLSHFILGILLCITIIGIPFGKQHFKLMNIAFMPFGKDLK